MSDDKKVEDKKLEDEVQPTFLSEEEKEKIKEKVRKKLDAENKKKIEQAYEDKITLEAKKKAQFKNAKPGEDIDGLVSVYIALPKVSQAIMIDGIFYHPETTYKVTPQVAETLYEIMGRGQQHEDIVTGRRDANLGRRRQNPLARL